MAISGRVTYLGHMTTQTTFHIPEWTMGDRLRKAREDAGLSQTELATRMGVSRQTVSNAEVGAREPLPITMRAWAQETSVPVEWLAWGSRPEPDPRPGGALTFRAPEIQKPPGLRVAWAA
jgi:transcriptional regulator with XRE-family HTH domain